MKNKFIEKIRIFFSDASVVRRLDFAVLITASISLFLLILKILAVLPDLDANLVTVAMMCVIIFIYGLKMLAGNNPGAGFQLIMFVIIILLLAFVLGAVRSVIFKRI